MSGTHRAIVPGTAATQSARPIEHRVRLHRDAGLERQRGSQRDRSVGGGEATLVDDLLEAGYRNIAVMDLSERALDVCRTRLAERAASVSWLAADVLEHEFVPHSIDVWHDRAAFHFIAEHEQRQRYVAQVLKALKPGGHAIVGAFGPQGPTQCSGLPVARYSSDDLHDEFGSRFQLLDHSTTLHTSPWGSTQQFVYCYCRREH